MKITLGKIAESIAILEKINNQNPDFKVDYWIMRNMKILADSYNFFIANQKTIYDKYCDIIDGKYFTAIGNDMIKFNLKPDVDASIFDKELNELLGMECENIEPYKLSIKAIENMSNIKLDKNEIHIIDYLLPE